MKDIFLQGTIELFVSLILSYLLVFKCGNSMRKNKNAWYIGASVVSLCSTVIAALVFLEILDVDFSVWWVRTIRGIISGYLPASIFMFVMYAGAVPEGRIKKTMMAVRTELSIIGVILYLPHTLLYTALSAPYGIMALLEGRFDLGHQLMTWSGLMNTVLLFVLGITSNRKIKAKMTLPKWRKLQKWSYLFYFNCFVHYMTLSVRTGHYERTVIYLIIYGMYLYLKLKKISASKKQIA